VHLYLGKHMQFISFVEIIKGTIYLRN
jgi:hypothetical protein